MPETKRTPKEVQPMQSTSGPWEYSDLSAATGAELANDFAITPTENCTAIAHVHHTRGYAPDRAEGEANAALIAASPDLLEAAKLIIQEVRDGLFTDDIPSTIYAICDDYLEPAIAKALLTKLRNAGT